MTKKSQSKTKSRDKDERAIEIIGIQGAEHIGLQKRIETCQRNFIEAGRAPEVDSYPKSQNTKIEDPQSSHSNKPVLTSVHPYRNTSEPR